MEPAWLLQETPRNRSMLAAGEREREWARRRARGCAGAREAGMRGARAAGSGVRACRRRLSLRSTLQTCWRWTPVRGGGAHRGPVSDRLRYTTVFHPASRQNVGFLNLWLAAGWCHLQVGGFGVLRRLRRRPAHSKGAGTGVSECRRLSLYCARAYGASCGIKGMRARRMMPCAQGLVFAPPGAVAQDIHVRGAVARVGQTVDLVVGELLAGAVLDELA